MGKLLKQGSLEFRVSEKFYGTEKITEKKLAELLREFGNINLVGEKCVAVALKENLISPKNIITIAGIPHAQIFKF